MLIRLVFLSSILFISGCSQVKDFNDKRDIDRKAATTKERQKTFSSRANVHHQDIKSLDGRVDKLMGEMEND